MVKKVEIIDLCKRIAEDYEGWEFVSNGFKDKRLKHSDKLINPLWTFSPGSALTQPLVGVYVKKIEKIYTQIHSKDYWTHFVTHISHYDEYKSNFRVNDIVKDKAEYRIRRIVDQGLALLEKTYDFSSEQALLDSIPFSNEEADGVKKCILQGMYGNYDFIKQYYNEEIETYRPKWLDLVKNVMDHFGIEEA